MKKNILLVLVFIFLIYIFINNNILIDSSYYAINLWIKKVFPFLFIMIIINDLLIYLDFPKLFNNIHKYILFTSIFSGSPTNAIIITNLLKSNLINVNDANNALMYSYYPNPLFLYFMINSIFNKQISFIIILSFYLSNIIIYNIYKNKKKAIINNIKIFNITNSIKKSLDITISVLGVIVFYLVISNYLIYIINTNIIGTILIKGLFEITQALDIIKNYNFFGKELITIIIIAFGGLSIHTQVKCILDNNNLNYRFFLKGRLISIIISVIILIIFLMLHKNLYNHFPF